MRFLLPAAADAAESVEKLRRLTALAGLALVGATWRLWIPQDGFPQVPFVEIAGRIPHWLEWAAAAVMLAGLLAGLLSPAGRPFWKWGLAAYAAATALLVLIDQHRLQPWAWQFVLIAAVLCSATPPRAILWLRALVVGIYFHSALSKFDASFLNTHGEQLVEAAIGAFGLSLDGASEALRRGLAILLPLGELVIAAGLCWPRTRKPAVWGAVLMHSGLLLALGPWGLDHKPGVLLWNVYFIAGNVVLFWEPAAARETAAADDRPAERRHARLPSQIGNGVSAAVVLAAVLLPFLEPLGWYDHWPAWSLYASRPERVFAFVHVLQRDALPPALREFTDPPSRGPWLRIDLDRWSLESLDAPIYPQGRFRIAVALAIAERYRLGDGVRVLIESPADRFSGKRTACELRGTAALRAEADRFLLNARARDDSQR